ncbi:MAG: hypothetical protein NTY20_04855 [Candidatus Aenigmarchaeota archaeon]|nr:hypothetical protein [Candidatus Aenigmarchaeota archaeon]
MEKIQVTEEITDYKDCIFSKACQEYKDRRSEPDVRCPDCGSYTSTILANKLKWD